MSKLEGKVAVITGGSSGIGLATAKKFVEEGAYVFITGRRQGELDKARVEIGKNVTAVQGDVANLADIDKLYEVVKTEKGVVDVVFANAGFVEHAVLGSISVEHYTKTFDINVRGVLFTVQNALPLMIRGGSIIVTSSIVGVKGIPAHGAYAGTKAAVRAFVRTWAAEFKDRGIRANTLSPGATETPIIDGQFATKEEAVAMVKKAMASIKEQGPDKAYAEISNKTGPFTDRDLYVVVYGLDGKVLAHGANEKLIVLDSDSGKVVATPAIGEDPDADLTTRRRRSLPDASSTMNVRRCARASSSQCVGSSRGAVSFSSPPYR